MAHTTYNPITFADRLEEVAELWRQWDRGEWAGAWTAAGINSQMDEEFRIGAEVFERFDEEMASGVRCEFCGRVQDCDGLTVYVNCCDLATGV